MGHDKWKQQREMRYCLLLWVLMPWCCTAGHIHNANSLIIVHFENGHLESVLKICQPVDIQHISVSNDAANTYVVGVFMNRHR